MKEQKLSIKSRIWICTEQGTYLGEGRIRLLKEIEEHGSISKAAKAMKMSYKKAWELVDSMNRQGATPLVQRTIGGTGGGGSELSDLGKKAIQLFHQLSENNRQYLNNQLEELNFQA